MGGGAQEEGPRKTRGTAIVPQAESRHGADVELASSRPRRYARRVLSIRSLAKTYPGPTPRTVLANVSLELAAGDYVAITGESGVGKSTLLNLAAGLDRPDAGSIEVDGVDLASLDDDALTLLRRRRMGFVFQAFHVLPYLTVGENVALPLALQRESPIAAGERVRAMLAAVGLGDRVASRPRELSGGELQRVAIARALIHRPALVLADEPTGNLDPDSAAVVLALLRDVIKGQGAAGILVTHSQAAAQTTDRTLLLTREGMRELALP
jgi:putative ABC transport system ATP-binding protein